MSMTLESNLKCHVTSIFYNIKIREGRNRDRTAGEESSLCVFEEKKVELVTFVLDFLKNMDFVTREIFW